MIVRVSQFASPNHALRLDLPAVCTVHAITRLTACNTTTRIETGLDAPVSGLLYEREDSGSDLSRGKYSLALSAVLDTASLWFGGVAQVVRATVS